MRHSAIFIRETGRWAAAHPIASSDKHDIITWAIDVDCPSKAAAQEAVERLNRVAMERWREGLKEQRLLWPFRERSER